MTYIVSSGALNSTHSLTHLFVPAIFVFVFFSISAFANYAFPNKKASSTYSLIATFNCRYFLSAYLCWNCHCSPNSQTNWLIGSSTAWLAGWLTPVPGDIHKAMCRYCPAEMAALISALKKHCRTAKHRKIMKLGRQQSSLLWALLPWLLCYCSVLCGAVFPTDSVLSDAEHYPGLQQSL